MTWFTTRVELHNADWSDYTQLHAQMKRQGFVQTISSSDGKVYELPPAEYFLEGGLTKTQVLERAKAAAGAVKKSFAAVVSETTGMTWSGLKTLS
jgi:hypothetical protein